MMKFNQFFILLLSASFKSQKFKVVCISFTRYDKDTIYELEIRADTLNIYARMVLQFFID